MNADADILISHLENDFADSLTASQTTRIIEFYEEATADYEHWSENFNMHLGFYRRGANFFRRETMLEQMNLEIAERLQINRNEETFLIDLGCGTGAVSRTIAKRFPNAKIKGVTIAASQIAIAEKLNAAENLGNRIEIIEADYTSLPFENETATAVWAAESACYADGAGKENLIREMARVLKIGGRFAVADCFVKQPEKKFNFLTGKCYEKVCECWALEEFATLENFVAALKTHGFENILIEDISLNIAPSLAHAPFAVSSFLFRKLAAGERLNRQSVNNLKASLLAIILGLNRAKFGYFLISGTRGEFSEKTFLY